MSQFDLDEVFGDSAEHAARELFRAFLWEGQMILGAQVIVYGKDAEADRAFFRHVLSFKSVDAGHGWRIFALPPEKLHSTHPMRMVPTNCISCATSAVRDGFTREEGCQLLWGSARTMGFN
jgi:hypothetical protein